MASETVNALLTYKSYAVTARKLGITVPALRDRVKRYKLQPIIDECVRDARNTLILHSEESANKLIDLTNSDDENVALKASESVLDRTGVTKSECNNTQVNILNNMSVEFVED